MAVVVLGTVSRKIYVQKFAARHHPEAYHAPTSYLQMLMEPDLLLIPWPILKFGNACWHLKQLEKGIQDWSHSAAIGTKKTLSDEGRTLTVTFEFTNLPPSSEWSLILGDAIHNLRSALDSLALDLARMGSVKPEQEKYVYFPICNTQKCWKTAVEKSLKTVAQDALDIIHHFQPFTRNKPNSSALLLLNQLSNRDKHRAAIDIVEKVKSIGLDGTKIRFIKPSPDARVRIENQNEILIRDGEKLLKIISTEPMQIEGSKFAFDISPLYTMGHEEKSRDLAKDMNVVMKEVEMILRIFYPNSPPIVTGDK